MGKKAKKRAKRLRDMIAEAESSARQRVRGLSDTQVVTEFGVWAVSIANPALPEWWIEDQDTGLDVTDVTTQELAVEIVRRDLFKSYDDWLRAYYGSVAAVRALRTAHGTPKEGFQA